MLQNFRDRIRNSRLLGYGIVIAIAIPFALLGIEAYLQGGDADVAAEVNGTPIQSQVVERQVSQQRAQLRQQFGGELPNMFSEGMLRQQVLDQLITQEVLRQVATEARMRIGDERLATRIREQQFFQQDGRFDRGLYEQTLRQAGLTPQRYEVQMRQAFRIEQLRGGLTDTAFVLPQEAREAARLERQERQVGVLELPRARAAEQVSVTEDDVRAYYEQHRDQFQRPAQVRLAYLELDPQAIAESIEVSDEELRAEHRQQQEQQAQEAERQAAHLLVEVPEDASEAELEAAREQAQQLRERLESGETDFATLAREHSDDPGSASQGGELGWIKRGTMVPAFEEALFAMDEAGAVSEPVRTGYGFHLIKLLEARDGEAGRSFADARAELEQQVRRRKAEGLFRDRAEVLRNSTYENPGSLEPAAQATGLEIQHSAWLSRREGDGIGTAAAVREAAFQPAVREQGVNSDLLELGDRRLAVVRVMDQRPAEPRPLAAVRDQVRAQVREQRIGEVLEDWSNEIVTRLDEGATPSDLAGPDAIYRDLGWIRRDGEAGAAIESAAFELAPPEGDASVHRTVSLQSGDQAVVILRAARLPEVEAPAVEQARTQQRRGLSRAEMDAWTLGLRTGAEITQPQ